MTQFNESKVISPLHPEKAEAEIANEQNKL